MARGDGPLSAAERRAIQTDGEAAVRLVHPRPLTKHSVWAFAGFCEETDFPHFRKALIDVLKFRPGVGGRLFDRCLAVASADGPLTPDERQWLEALCVLLHLAPPMWDRLVDPPARMAVARVG